MQAQLQASSEALLATDRAIQVREERFRGRRGARKAKGIIVPAEGEKLSLTPGSPLASPASPLLRNLLRYLRRGLREQSAQVPSLLVGARWRLLLKEGARVHHLLFPSSSEPYVGRPQGQAPGGRRPAGDARGGRGPPGRDHMAPQRSEVHPKRMAQGPRDSQMHYLGQRDHEDSEDEDHYADELDF